MKGKKKKEKKKIRDINRKCSDLRADGLDRSNRSAHPSYTTPRYATLVDEKMKENYLVMLREAHQTEVMGSDAI